ncbi:MAG: hypothetical protein GC145_14970 [Caulobacter sp.]|nr:hypothetical protein [Caulobacter sp.]
MGSQHHRLNDETFERLREQLAAAAALCGDDQLLDLADCLHDSIRRRKSDRWTAPAARGQPMSPSAHRLHS